MGYPLPDPADLDRRTVLIEVRFALRTGIAAGRLGRDDERPA
jgi:hypothetical protein